jgi:putative ABC transport system substrate-binding protein
MQLKRREFVALLGCAAAASPLAARAQQPAIPAIGYLYSGAPETGAHFLTAFRKGLSESGFSEGQNVTIEYRWGHNDPERLPELAGDLVRRRVAVIVSPGTAAATLAAKAATTTIPIVFRTGGDPVELGFVASLNRPGGNVTGINAMSAEVGNKRLGLLQELLPGAARFTVLFNPNDLNG